MRHDRAGGLWESGQSRVLGGNDMMGPECQEPLHGGAGEERESSWLGAQEPGTQSALLTYQLNHHDPLGFMKSSPAKVWRTAAGNPERAAAGS